MPVALEVACDPLAPGEVGGGGADLAPGGDGEGGGAGGGGGGGGGVDVVVDGGGGAWSTVRAEAQARVAVSTRHHTVGFMMSILDCNGFNDLGWAVAGQTRQFNSSKDDWVWGFYRQKTWLV